ncbi:LysE family transporter [Sporosarcina ureilytica]|uniref:Amino acid transporter n=1 Tax=Sporosarcina ureilytica TaxID=298596 RepID=A0A1D8JJ25_9BACL|nr:LysE family transporter [Sporosarcina ureilytica]AOV08707.1 amino acid transporter [Sporosarcina ureilytica]
MNSIFTFFFLGASLAAPIGPVKTVLLNMGIRHGFFHAWLFALGTLATDLMYMTIVYFGVGQFIDQPLVKTILWSFGCFVLLYTGIENLLSVHKIEQNLKSGRYVRLRKSMLAGFLMALLNPLTILFWLGIYGSILAKAAGTTPELQIIFNSFAILAGIAIVDISMSFLSSGARKLLSVKLLTIVSIFTSFSMIGFGIYFGIQAFQALF